ncbi:DUF4352 domain-containing protein [Chloroflexia bacterium SDU3-3]|nr:DUF4352 domain-containing protein [Chloroflexia bacterium SDU3-3]
MRRLCTPIITFLTVISFLIPLTAYAQSESLCFSETGFCISGRIREYWQQNGGLPVFGYPVTDQHEEQIEGKPYQVQWFQRNRLELHPENGRPYDVLLGRLGADRLAQQGRDPFTFSNSESQAGCRYFAETQQNVCGDILKAWRASGIELDGKGGKTEAENLALFGLPLSDLMTETMADGQQRQVQWFERARFELHPENAAPYNVQLGLLGNEIREAAAAPQPTAAPAAPTAAPSPIQPQEVLDSYRKKMPAGLWQVNVNGVQVSATGFKYTDSINRYKATKDEKYVVFAVEVANTGWQSRYRDSFFANPASFDLIDLDGGTHTVETALYSLDNRFDGGNFYNGTKASGVLVFKIPKNSAPAIVVFDGPDDSIRLDLRVAPIQ